MTPADVDRAIAWSQARGVRLDFAFNGGGSDLYREQTGAASDPLADQVQPARRQRRVRLHQPHLRAPEPRLLLVGVHHAADHAATSTWAQSRGISVANPGELVTGEHSGLANTRPGNPGTIDPPSFDDLEPAATGGAVPGGTYDYALTAALGGR